MSPRGCLNRAEVIDLTETSSQDQNLERAVEQDSVELDKTTPHERISERMEKHIRETSGKFVEILCLFGRLSLTSLAL